MRLNANKIVSKFFLKTFRLLKSSDTRSRVLRNGAKRVFLRHVTLGRKGLGVNGTVVVIGDTDRNFCIRSPLMRMRSMMTSTAEFGTAKLNSGLRN